MCSMAVSTMACWATRGAAHQRPVCLLPTCRERVAGVRDDLLDVTVENSAGYKGRGVEPWGGLRPGRCVKLSPALPRWLPVEVAADHGAGVRASRNQVRWASMSWRTGRSGRHRTRPLGRTRPLFQVGSAHFTPAGRAATAIGFDDAERAVLLSPAPSTTSSRRRSSARPTAAPDRIVTGRGAIPLLAGGTRPPGLVHTVRPVLQQALR